MYPSLYFHPLSKSCFVLRNKDVTQNALLSLRDLKGKLNGELQKLALQIAIQLLLLDLAQQFAHIYSVIWPFKLHINHWVRPKKDCLLPVYYTASTA